MFNGGTPSFETGSLSSDALAADPATVPTSELPKAVLEAQLAAQRHQADYLELLAEAKRRGCTKDSMHRSQAIWLAK